MALSFQNEYARAGRRNETLRQRTEKARQILSDQFQNSSYLTWGEPQVEGEEGSQNSGQVSFDRRAMRRDLRNKGLSRADRRATLQDFQNLVNEYNNAYGYYKESQDEMASMNQRAQFYEDNGYDILGYRAAAGDYGGRNNDVVEGDAEAGWDAALYNKQKDEGYLDSRGLWQAKTPMYYMNINGKQGYYSMNDDGSWNLDSYKASKDNTISAMTGQQGLAASQAAYFKTHRGDTGFDPLASYNVAEGQQMGAYTGYGDKIVKYVAPTEGEAPITTQAGYHYYVDNTNTNAPVYWQVGVDENGIRSKSTWDATKKTWGTATAFKKGGKVNEYPNLAYALGLR